MLNKVVIFFIFLFSVPSSADKVFRCESDFPKELQIPAPDSCNQLIVADITKKKASEKEFNLLLEKNITTNNNMGATLVNFGQGKKAIYRSSTLSENPACLEELVAKYKVNTFSIYIVVNLLMKKN